MNVFCSCSPTSPGTKEPEGWRYSLLGGSWVVISRVISRVIITHIRGLITPLLNFDYR